MKPVVEVYGGVHVVREDLFPGGTKARYLAPFFEQNDELVYATPACGGAQFALATIAARLGKKLTLVVAQRIAPHARTIEARRLGAKIIEVRPGYLAVTQARAREHAARTGAYLVPFGLELPGGVESLASAALSTGVQPDEVWCAAGSGVLARAMRLAYPRARHHVVIVGRELTPGEVGGAQMHRYPLPFMALAPKDAPFNCDLNYDAKAWEFCQARKGPGTVLFWNVAGDPFHRAERRMKKSA